MFCLQYIHSGTTVCEITSWYFKQVNICAVRQDYLITKLSGLYSLSNNVSDVSKFFGIYN